MTDVAVCGSGAVTEAVICVSSAFLEKMRSYDCWAFQKSDQTVSIDQSQLPPSHQLQPIAAPNSSTRSNRRVTLRRSGTSLSASYLTCEEAAGVHRLNRGLAYYTQNTTTRLLSPLSPGHPVLINQRVSVISLSLTHSTLSSLRGLQMSSSSWCSLRLVSLLPSLRSSSRTQPPKHLPREIRTGELTCYYSFTPALSRFDVYSTMLRRLHLQLPSTLRRHTTPSAPSTASLMLLPSVHVLLLSDRAATLILSLFSSAVNFFACYKLLTTWFSVRWTWSSSEESEWEGLSWKLDTMKALGAIVCAYFFVGGVASVVGLVGVIKVS